MRIVWSSDVADQIIRRMSDAEQGMGDCLRDANGAIRALEEANEDGESNTLNRLTERLMELTRRMQAAQRQMDELIGQTRSTNERFEEVERRISAMIDAVDSEPVSQTNQQPQWYPVIDRMEIMPLLREMSGWYTPDWLSALASDPQNFLMM